MKVKYGFKIHSESEKKYIGLVIPIISYMNMNVLNINYAKIILTRQINKSSKLRHTTN